MKKPMTEAKRQKILFEYNVYAMSKEKHIETLLSEGYTQEAAKRIYKWRTTPVHQQGSMLCVEKLMRVGR